MFYSKTTIKSENSAHYLKSLCRHFARKVPATWDDHQGEVNFAMGNCNFTLIDTSDELELVCSAEAIEPLATVKKILEQHILMLSRRETIALIWSHDKSTLE